MQIFRAQPWSCRLEEEDKETQLTIIENIEEILREGERQGWFPDLDLYEDIFGLMCEDDKKGLVAEEMLFEILEVGSPIFFFIETQLSSIFYGFRATLNPKP